MQWSQDFPTKPGYYWFYGDPFGNKRGADGLQVRLHWVRAYQGANSLVVVSDMNSFMYWDEVVGLWTQAIPPELPENQFNELITKE